MFLLISIVLAGIFGFLAKGSLKNLSHAPLRGVWFPVAGLILQEAALLAAARWSEAYGLWMWATTILSYSAILLFALVNRQRVLSSFFIAAGTVSNFLVIAANGFKMPVSPAILNLPSYIQSSSYGKEMPDYFIATGGAKLLFLGDVIYLPIPYFEGFLSVGDILISVGAFALIVSLMTKQEGKRMEPGRKVLFGNKSQ